jgi:hypothetical protein
MGTADADFLGRKIFSATVEFEGTDEQFREWFQAHLRPLGVHWRVDVTYPREAYEYEAIK